MSYNGDTSPEGAYPVKKERRGRRSELPEDLAKKLKSCSVMGCEEWRDLTAHTTYHCFPTGDKNQQRWEIWTSLLQKAREDTTWIPFRGSLVCSSHFRATDFVQDPNQKRTKLVKNAIPSIFPTFTVDLDDPSFMLDDTSEFEDNETPYFDGDYDYSNQNSYDYDQQDLEDAEFPVPEVQYDDDEMDEQELQYVHQRPNPARSRPPALLPATTVASHNVRKAHPIFPMEDEPPKKKLQLANSSGGATKLAGKPPLLYQGSSRMEDFNGNRSQLAPSRQVSNQPKSKLYEQLCKSNSPASHGSQKRSFSWNPDLEIEALGPAPDDYADLRQRIEELENEQDVQKQKYEAQIRALQRKIKDQDRIINEYAVQMNSLKRQRT